MAEKESIKVSLGTTVCIFIIVILLLIICGGFYYYNNIKVDNNSYNIQIDDNKNDVNEASVTNIINEKTQTKNNIISESEALKIGKEKYEKATVFYLGQIEYDLNNNVQINDIPYSKIENQNEIKELFSKNGLYQYLQTNEFVKELDGQYYRINADRGGDATYIGNELEIVSVDENKIVFNSIEKYAVNMDDLVQGKRKEDIESNKIINLYSIVKENEEWKVESFTLPF